jgi:hypothetical protein
MPPPSPTAVNTSVYAQSLISASLVFLLGGGGRAREEPARGVGTVHVSWGRGGGGGGRSTVYANKKATQLHARGIDRAPFRGLLLKDS